MMARNRRALERAARSRESTMADESTLVHEHGQFPGSRFADVDLSDSVFEDVNLQGTTFSNVALSRVRFQNVNLSHASIEDANLEGMKINGVLVRDLFHAYANREQP
jgi:uncharacterized protein YjbI with pentapeptide repeats